MCSVQASVRPGYATPTAAHICVSQVPAGPHVPADECSQAQHDHPNGVGIDATRCVSDCVTGIAPDADTMWTLGQVFLRNFYVVFDRDANRVGMARSAAPGST
jgi:hypothetical protein